jgi:hypothetical protein
MEFCEHLDEIRSQFARTHFTGKANTGDSNIARLNVVGRRWITHLGDASDRAR